MSPILNNVWAMMMSLLIKNKLNKKTIEYKFNHLYNGKYGLKEQIKIMIV